MSASFTKEDQDKMREFSGTLLNHAKWDGISTKELMKIYGLLMWYNTLDEKIAGNIFEIKSEGSLDDNVQDIDNNNEGE